MEAHLHHKTNTINVGNRRANLILSSEDEGINEPSSCTGTGNHNLVTGMWDKVSAPTKKKRTWMWKRGNFQKLKGIISKKLIRGEM